MMLTLATAALFVIGAGLGISIVASALFGDHKARPREERGPR